MDDMLTVAEASRFLGVARGTLYSWRYRGDGPRSYTIGTAVRYRRTDLEDYLTEHSSDRVEATA